MSEQLSPGASKVSAIFLGTIVLLITILGVWFWAGQLEESITVAGQMVPEGKLRRVMAPVSGIVTRVMVEENQIQPTLNAMPCKSSLGNYKTKPAH